MPVGTKVTMGDHRPWSSKWHSLLEAHEQLRLAYENADGLGNAEVERRVNHFCSECHDMRDWLRNDLPPGVTEDEVRTWSRQPPLDVASDLANTHKHHTLDQGGKTTRVREVEIRPERTARVTIEVDWASPNATTVDALDLADGCVASWRAFWAKHGMAVP